MTASAGKSCRQINSTQQQQQQHNQLHKMIGQSLNYGTDSRGARFSVRMRNVSLLQQISPAVGPTQRRERETNHSPQARNVKNVFVPGVNDRVARPDTLL